MTQSAQPGKANRPLAPVASAPVAGNRNPGDGLRRIIAESTPLGGIYDYDYDSAIVLTEDKKKQDVGGIARSSFLLAAAVSHSPSGLTLDEDEIVLLRVRGVTPLPNESELTSTRVDVVRKAYNRNTDFDDVTDVGTAGLLQSSGLDCEILGTFYADDENGKIAFGSDVDNIYSAVRYRVFVPSARVLSWIASYPRTTDDGDDLVIPIGNVRYSATQRKAKLAGLDQARVDVHVADFVGRKTALLGMTRSGKSNSIKTLVTAVYRYAAESGRNVGQVIFDPQGEYANVNKQDHTGLRLLGDEDRVRIYKVTPDPQLPQEKPLRLDFYDFDMLDVAWGLTADFLAEENAAYIEKFCNTNLEAPDRGDYPAGKSGDKDFSSAERAVARGRLAFYGLLSKSGFKGSKINGSSIPGQQAKIEFPITESAAADLLDEFPGSMHQSRPGTYYVDSPRGAKEVSLWISNNLDDRDDLKSWHDCDPFMAIREVLRRGGGIATAKLSSLRDFHDNTAKGEVNEAVWDDMQHGRLSIVDLSVGNPAVTARIAERIVNHLLEKASERFRTGLDPVQLQVVVEEAHNLFERSASTAVANPWVRLSKEAAKYGMGLVYATQEVTSVDRRILSNTSNWLIAHLNSSQETAELGRYYDFEVFADGIRKVDEKGFVRLKTYSGRYIVPVQIAKFDHSMINDARVAAGLKRVNVDGTEMQLEAVIPVEEDLGF